MSIRGLCIILAGCCGLIGSGSVWAADVLVRRSVRPIDSFASLARTEGGTGEEAAEVSVSHADLAALMRLGQAFNLTKYPETAIKLRDFERRYLDGGELPTKIVLCRTVEEVKPPDYPNSFKPEMQEAGEAGGARRKCAMWKECDFIRPRGFMGVIGSAFCAGKLPWFTASELMKSKKLDLTDAKCACVVDLGWFYKYWGAEWDAAQLQNHFYPLLGRLRFEIRDYFPAGLKRNLSIHPGVYWFSVLDDVIGRLAAYTDANLNQKCVPLNSLRGADTTLITRVIDDFIAPYMVFNGDDRSRFHKFWSDIITGITSHRSYYSGEYSPVPLVRLVNLHCFWLTITAYAFRQISPAHQAAADKVLLLTRYIARHVARRKADQQRFVMAYLVGMAEPGLFGEGEVRAIVERMTPECLAFGSPSWWPSRIL